MSEFDAIHAEVVSNPSDVTSRLVIADFLEEMGDPRGEFIRLQCLLDEMCQFDPRYPDLKDREKELLDESREQWSLPPQTVSPHLFTAMRFRRGFIEEIGLELPLVHQHWPALRTWMPIRLYEVARDHRFARPEIVTALRRQPIFDTIKALRLREAQLTVPEIADLAACSELENIESLDLANKTGFMYDRTLKEPPSLSRLIQSPHLIGLRHLNLSNIRFFTIGNFSRTGFIELRRLELNSCRMGEKGLLELSKGPFVPKLQYLNISTNSLTPKSMEYLAKFKALEWLELSGNRMDSSMVGALADANLPNLRILQLQASQMDDESVDTLIASRLIEQLDCLDIRHNSVTFAGLNAIANHPYNQERLQVFVENNRVSSEELSKIIRKFPRKFRPVGWPANPKIYE